MGKNVLGISLLAASFYTFGHYFSHLIGKALNFSADTNVWFVTAIVFVATLFGTWFVLKMR